jgi:flavin reductase (DIM6/NTAB) family NADH-FMN oxidoreductase RutF
VTTDVRTGVPGSAEALRYVMGRFVSGVTIVTALRNDIKYAMTATAVSSVSLEPPLILVCVSKTSRFHRAIMEVDTWAISLLAADQLAIARHFSNRARDLLTQFDDVDHVDAPVSGAPLIEGATAWMECTTYARYDGGDHTIVVGELIRASGPRSVDEAAGESPLTYYQGAYWPQPTAPKGSLP